MGSLINSLSVKQEDIFQLKEELDSRVCKNCKFAIQLLHNMACEHNNEYIYPPANWSCRGMFIKDMFEAK